jgi:hypothetical protein
MPISAAAKKPAKTIKKKTKISQNPIGIFKTYSHTN